MAPRRHRRRPLGSPVVPCRSFGGGQPARRPASSLLSGWAGPWLLLPPARAVGVFYVGMVWQEPVLSFAATFRKLRRAS